MSAPDRKSRLKEELVMTQNKGNQPEPKEIARQVEQLVKQTPPEVIERMKQRLEERRSSSVMDASGELMTKRVG